MKTVGLVLLILIALIAAGIVFVFITYKRRQRKEQRFLDQLRANEDILALRTTIVEERISDDDFKVLHKRVIEGGELLIGRGFLVPVYLGAAIHSTAILPGGVSGMVWSIPLDKCEPRGDSLIVECTTPGDEDSFTRLTCEGILAGGNHETVLGALGISQKGAV
jgi:hypothetical protein